jgi:hypothetical protein
MNGTATETVASSWIEALGGVSICWIFSTPPVFWAQVAFAIASPVTTTLIKARHMLRAMLSSR